MRVEHNAKRNDYLVTQRERLADSETVQQINLAWHHRNDSNFGHELDRRGFIVARVTDDEAKASKAARDEAKAEREKQVAALTAANATERAAKVEAKGLPRQWEAGQLVAVNSFGHAYALDLFTVQGEIAEVNSTLQTMTGDYASMSLAKEGQKVRYEKQIESQRQEAAQRLAGRDDVKTLREHWQAKNTTSDGVQQFFENIKEAGFTVACVDAKEAKHSQINAEIARNYSPDYFIPTYDAGEMIAFAASGASYRLNGITLDDKHAGNQLTDYLATQPAMMNLTEARETIRENREAERAEPQIQIAPIVGDALGAGNLGAKVTVKGLESIGNAVDSVVDGIAGFLFGGLGHTSSPAIHYEQNATAARTIPAAPEAQPSQARQVREEGKRAEKGGGDSRGASWEAFKESHLQQFDPEIIEAMRRRREEQERQEREDRSRERGRER